MPRVAPFALLVLALAAGCSSSTPTVDGTVTVDGQLLKEGTITFIPTDPTQGGTAGGLIKDGKFSVQVPLGDMTVKISAPKVVGKRKAYNTPDSPTVDITEELLPARYNTQSQLKITVKKGGQKEKFELTTEKK
jgi:hypothetical protein